jgi:hypothetical protein
MYDSLDRKYIGIIQDFVHRKLTEAEVERTPKRVSELADLHDHLVDTVLQINACFSLQLFMTISVTFCYNIFNVFFFYQSVVKSSGAVVWSAFGTAMWSVLYQVYNTGAICLVSLTTRAGKRTAIFVHKVINSCRDEGVIDSVRTARKILKNQTLF